MKDSKQTISGNTDDYSYEIKTIDATTIEISVQVTPEKFVKVKDHAYTHLAPNVKIRGFRPGKAPKSLIEANLGMDLYEETVAHVLPEVTAEIITKHEFEPLDNANYSVKDFGDDKGMTYTATFTVVPQITLPNFKKLQTKKVEVKVTDEEVDKLFDQLVKDIRSSQKAKDGVKDEVKSEGKKAEKVEKDNGDDIDWPKQLNKEELKTSADVKKLLRENLLKQKQQQEDEKYLTDLVKEAIELAGLSAPVQLIKSQSAAKEKQYVSRIKELGLEIEEFLKMQNSTIENMREMWDKEAALQISSDFLFIAISKEQKLKVEPAEIDQEIAGITDEKLKEQYKQPQNRNYIASVLLRQKAVDWLKNQVS
jgi:FKBP-type peptidyl-prolyl cis-trans isomerase (trigger factor)